MLTCGSVFSGIGLLDYGLHLAGLHHAWLCERDEWRRGILARRFPGARIADDVRHIGHGFDPVHVLAGGFPCKGASSIGKREGFGHPETVLWREMARAIRELRPRYVLVENVADILSLHDGKVWGEVVGTLAALGYDTTWDCLPAAAVGAPHLRDRVFAVAADANEPRADAHATAGTSRAATGERNSASTHATQLGHERAGGRSRLERAGDGPTDGCSAVADSAWDAEGGPGETPRAKRKRTRTRPVDWGEYLPAIRRWERVHGPAPAPLVERVRGVDARHATRMERSRLSALGDGVQVQVGRIAGEYIIDLERGRLAT